ncbi:mannose-6-phosphate isomerase, class I, partial [Salmonella enterica]|nr:mannose-6-phosphate isomerase, class I [Salmonella enterica]
MQKLINSVQNYAWGSKTALTELYGIANPQQQPMAELWMGAHPKSSSRITTANGETVSLRDAIEKNKTAMLGEAVANHFGELPFLFKVLCAAQPLSIQVHPNKRNSEIGFAKENAAGIPMDAAERNYKDPNHKPELVFALTPFLAMNAFREFSDIVSLLQPVAGAHSAIAHFLQAPNAERLSQLFASLLNMQGEEKSRALAVLKAALNSQQGEPWQTIRVISEYYPDD